MPRYKIRIEAEADAKNYIAAMEYVIGITKQSALVIEDIRVDQMGEE